MTTSNIPARIRQLRRAMASSGVHACIINGSDPHGSERPPARWRTREWISGFTGSAGFVVITPETAGLWTDFRYWIQAAAELEGSGVQLHRMGEPQVPSIGEYLADILPQNAVLSFDARTVSAARAAEWTAPLSDHHITLHTHHHLIDDIWSDRPALPAAPVYELSIKEAGESRSSRLSRLREALHKAGADSWIGVALDSCAWLLNIRGSDIPFNPVVLGFIILTPEGVTWYTDLSRLPESLTAALTADKVRLSPYEHFYRDIPLIHPPRRVLADSTAVMRRVLDLLPEETAVIDGTDPAALMKAVKNDVEIQRTRRAMEKDGAAMARFLMDIETSLARGERITEIEAAEMLRARRAEIPGFLEESFTTIAAAGGNGALCHYQARPGREGVLSEDAGMFLIDSGGQWDEGTTDITRTVSLTAPADQQKRDYTLVLKAHIALSRIRFPAGTRGYQLDAVCRGELWKVDIDFGHGSGHGVGYRLDVHEGPQVLSIKPVDVTIEPGMIISNEPGIYREERWGIRTENLLVCREHEENEFGRFFAFETLTLAPYHRRLIDVNLLEKGEIEWVNDYHAQVLRRLQPLLDESEQSWLRRAAAPLLCPPAG